MALVECSIKNTPGKTFLRFRFHLRSDNWGEGRSPVPGVPSMFDSLEVKVLYPTGWR
jgi:hypothetical protein